MEKTNSKVPVSEDIDETDENQLVEISESSFEKDAVPIPKTAAVSAKLPVSERVSNNLSLSQTNSATSYTFNGCNGITLGSVFQVGSLAPARSTVVSTPKRASPKFDESVYKKTPTIKAMMESSEPISTAFLNFISSNFGSRWREITILLEINQLFVDRMYEDYFYSEGTKEVVYQVLAKYLKENSERATVGWLTTYLWQNKFRKTIWTVKEDYKKLKEAAKMEREFDSEV